ncbi:MAG: hypothetical protein HRU75_03375 [Planctomycetia bacterium]|nr:MAG: hypothetical protein HRU75_03375 [Planctomycetia bacterium]
MTRDSRPRGSTRRPALGALGAVVIAICLLPLVGCASAQRADTPQSPLGRALAPIVITSPPTERQAAMLRDLDEARRHREAHPDDLDAILWHGRRLGYLWRMEEAVAAFSDAAAKHPNRAEPLRHRGHRLISLRRFDAAVRDLRRATELIAGHPDAIEPDGQPNARNQPRSTLHFNVWYHLALAEYLRGRWAESAAAWQTAWTHSHNDDSRVAVAHWYYLTLARSGRTSEAQQLLARIQPGMDVIENHAYRDRLELFAGRRSLEDALRAASESEGIEHWGLAIGMTYLLCDEPDRAGTWFERIVAGDSWPSFGFIAAEAELVRRAANEPHAPKRLSGG